MEQSWTDNLPKLLPSWHDAVAQYFLQQKTNHRFVKDLLPDYGGAGIDVSASENGMEYIISKHGINQVNLGARVCALPFFPYRKMQLEEDPCLSQLSKQKENYNEFCTRLHFSRSAINNIKFSKHKRNILLSHKRIKNMLSSGKLEEVPLPQSIVELAKIFPQSIQVPKVNFGYSGGCLCTLQMNDDSPILLHPAGDRLNRLAVTPLEKSNEVDKAFKPTSTVHVKLKGGCIQQIKSAFNGFCYVKQETHCHFVNLTNLKAPYSESINEQNVNNIAPSPYIPVEFLSIHDGGKIILNDVEESNAVWETEHFYFSDKYLCASPIDCGFGSHPRSILYLDDKKMYNLDARLKGNNRSTLFSTNHASCYSHEFLLAMKRLSVNAFQNLVFSNFHLFLCDERYPDKPVLIWNHLLKSSPIYCDIATYNTNPDSSDAILLLGTQDTQELVSFAVRTQHSQVQAVSLTPPLSLSSPSDWVNSLKYHGQHVEDTIEKRVSYPLVGVCAIPHSKQPAFTAFQITSFGDVFYQDFKKVLDPRAEKTYRVDAGCVLSPPDRLLPHISQWIEIPDTSASVEEEAASICDIHRVNVDLVDVLKSPNEISDWCDMCKSIYPYYEDKLVSSDICPSCGLERSQSNELHKGYNELSAFIGPLSENLQIQMFDNIEKLSQFNDHYSKRILDRWTSFEDNAIGTPPWDYNSDFSLTSLSPASSVSYSTFSTPLRSVEADSQLDATLLASQLSSQSLFEDDTLPDISMFSQQSMEDFVPPSQEVRPKIGETLRTPKKSKILSKLNISSAGF